MDDTPEPGAEAPIPEGAEPVVPLDREDPTYDLWKKKREDLSAGREPGPIDVQRCPGGLAFQGNPTFFRLPVALTPEDLSAGDVDVAIISAHTDMGIGVRGASRGPNDLRANGDVYGTWGAFSMPQTHTMVNPFEQLTVVDYGDAPVDPLSTERSFHAVREIVREVASARNGEGKNVIPLIVGGDHSLTYPNLAAMADVYGKGEIGVVHFDAHFDGSLYFGHLINHGGWVKRLIDEGHVPGKNYIQVALRGYYPALETFAWMRENEFRYHTMAEVENCGWDAVMADVLKEAKDGPEYLYVSFDIDTIDRGAGAGYGHAGTRRIEPARGLPAGPPAVRAEERGRLRSGRIRTRSRSRLRDRLDRQPAPARMPDRPGPAQERSRRGLPQPADHRRRPRLTAARLGRRSWSGSTQGLAQFALHLRSSRYRDEKPPRTGEAAACVARSRVGLALATSPTS